MSERLTPLYLSQSLLLPALFDTLKYLGGGWGHGTDLIGVGDPFPGSQVARSLIAGWGRQPVMVEGTARNYRDLWPPIFIFVLPKLNCENCPLKLGQFVL